MLKITLTALVAICAVLPGRLNATAIPHVNCQTVSPQVELQVSGPCMESPISDWGSDFSLNIESDLEQGEMDPKLVETILKEASLKYSLDLTKLVDQVQKGEVVIEKQLFGYTLVEAKSGGITIAIIDEF